MNKQTFETLWKASCKQFLKQKVKRIDKTGENDCIYTINKLCHIDDHVMDDVFDTYCAKKAEIKTKYTNKEDATVNSYKRAAILMYAVIMSNPVILHPDIDDAKFCLLKQRFAFYIAYRSIVAEYDSIYIIEKKPLLEFTKIGQNDQGYDSFSMSLYKDLLFSEVFGNYNVLTMSNMLGLFFENVVKLDPTRKTPNKRKG